MDRDKTEDIEFAMTHDISRDVQLKNFSEMNYFIGGKTCKKSRTTNKNNGKRLSAKSFKKLL